MHHHHFYNDGGKLLGVEKTNGLCPRLVDYSVVLWQDALYLFGGFVDGTELSNKLFEYKIEKKCWKRIKYRGTLVPRARAYHTAVVHNHNMYILGGAGKTV